MSNNKGGKKLRGGGIIGSVGNFIFNTTLIVALLMLMMVALIFAGLLVGIYLIMNDVLAGTNFVIRIANKTIMPVIKGIIDVINGIIRAINSLTG
jgi:hypothetical protein